MHLILAVIVLCAPPSLADAVGPPPDAPAAPSFDLREQEGTRSYDIATGKWQEFRNGKWIDIAAPIKDFQPPKLPKLPNLTERLHAVAQSHRQRSGLPRQELDPELNAISQRWAERMARENSMYHGGGENIIAYGTTTPEATIQMWINSPGHRAFVLGGNTRAGWGAARAKNGTWYWAGAFRNHPRPVAKLAEAGKIAGKATARTVSAPVRFAKNRIGRRR